MALPSMTTAFCLSAVAGLLFAVVVMPPFSYSRTIAIACGAAIHAQSDCGNALRRAVSVKAAAPVLETSGIPHHCDAAFGRTKAAQGQCRPPTLAGAMPRRGGDVGR